MAVEQGKKTLLIVDDTELFIQLQISHLGRKRYNIHTAKNGNDGLEMARSLKPDLILLDLLMPDMNGDQVSRILKGDPETSSIPVILVSSGTKEHSRSVIMSSRCDGLIFKPVRRDLLLSVVENLLETNLRLYDRIEVSIPCTATFEGKEISGTIHCLGGNGAFVEVDEKLIRSDYLHELSAGVYDELSYYHDIRGIQEICERKDMKLAIAKYLELYKRTSYRPKKRSRKKGSKTL